jgi:hypothetical protein
LPACDEGAQCRGCDKHVCCAHDGCLLPKVYGTDTVAMAV